MGGENIKTVSSRLGHADIKITMNTYAQALEEADQTAASKFNDFMSKKA
jgi:integrase